MKTTDFLFIFIIFTIKVCLHVPHNISGKLENICYRLSVFHQVFYLINAFIRLILFLEGFFASECLFLPLYLHTYYKHKDIDIINSLNRSKKSSQHFNIGKFCC
jgi:hypothetical protein